MSDILTEVRFWAQVVGDSKRTVFCSPENESRCKGYVAARGLDYLITVEATPAVPDDKVFVIDPGAMQASVNKMLSRPIRLR